MADATPQVVSVAGQFSSSDTASPIVAPNGIFALSFGVDSNPTPLAGSVSSLGFDVPLLAFSYTLNGVLVAPLALSEIHFDTLANGGLFDLTIGSGLNAAQFIFQGVQMFGGALGAPTFSVGKFSLASWTFSDPKNFDVQSPSGAFVTLAPAPEPSSLGLFAIAALSALAAVRWKFNNSVR
jgi:hypothetical protein